MQEELWRAASGTTVEVHLPDDTPRPLALLATHKKAFAGLWRSLPDTIGVCPGWCYLPTCAAALAMYRDVTGHLPAIGGDGLEIAGVVARHHPSHPTTLAALAAWRMGKGIYRFDGEVLAKLWSTPITGKIPVEVLYRMPEWCPYVEFPPGFAPTGAGEEFEDVRGFFVFLDWQPGHAPRLMFLLDRGEPFPDGKVQHGAQEEEKAAAAEARLTIGAEPCWLELAGDTLEACVKKTVELTFEFAAHLEERDIGEAEKEEILRKKRAEKEAQISPLVSVVLYLCATNAEISAADGSARMPANPEPRKVKKRGEKVFAANGVSRWDVAWRLGAALRGAKEAPPEWAPEAGSGTGARRRPHIRRAHWHSYWVGPRSPERADERRLVLKWVLPVGINVAGGDEGSQPAVVRRVR